MFQWVRYRNVRGAVGDVTERRIFTTCACVATLLLGLLAGFFNGVLARG